MAFGTFSTWDVRATGNSPPGADTNGGGFLSAIANMATDLATLQTTADLALVSCSSASYSAQARDITHWAFIGAGTGWYPGWYQIASLCGSTATVTAGGTNYAVNDILTVSGGTSTATTKFKVASITGSAVATVTLDTLGAYSVLPANAVATTTGGAGTGCTLTVLWGFNLTATLGAGYLLDSGFSYAVTTAQGTCTSNSPAGNATWTIDYSQNTAIPFTDFVIGGTTTDFTSSTKPVGVNYIGNTMNVTSGGTVQRSQIVSVSGTTATCDKSLGTGGNSCVGNLGGPLATPGLAASLMVVGNVMFLQAATYTCSNSSNVAGGRVTLSLVGTTTNPSHMIGWNTTRHVLNYDATKPLMNATANSVLVVTLSGTDVKIRNIKTGRSAAETTVTGIAMTGSHIYVEACQATGVVTGLTSNAGSSQMFANCYADTCTNGFNFSVTGGNVKAFACVAKANTGSGFNVGDFGVILVECIAFNGTGTADGFAFGASNGTAINCTAYGNAGDGFQFNSAAGQHILWNCLGVGNGTWQFNQGTSTETARMLFFCGAKADGSGTDNLNPIQKMAFTTLTADPYVNGTAGDFQFNNTPGGGLVAVIGGGPNTFPGTSTISYLPIGAVRANPLTYAAPGVSITYANIVARFNRSTPY